MSVAACVSVLWWVYIVAYRTVSVLWWVYIVAYRTVSVLWWVYIVAYKLPMNYELWVTYSTVEEDLVILL